MTEEKDIPTRLLEIANTLNERLSSLSFVSPVEYIYNPVEYAFDMYSKFVHKYCSDKKKILLLGMNPGPWGMAQTGIPFGEIHMVKEWYEIDGVINKPQIECPSRKIMGLNCTVEEESGKRMYKLFKGISGRPEVFLRDTFLYNFCPLAMLTIEGWNITPQGLEQPVEEKLAKYCRDALFQVLETLEIKFIIAIGRYVQRQAEALLEEHNVQDVEVIYLRHPSPRVDNNENWVEYAQEFLEENDFIQYFTP